MIADWLEELAPWTEAIVDDALMAVCRSCNAERPKHDGWCPYPVLAAALRALEAAPCQDPYRDDALRHCCFATGKVRCPRCTVLDQAEKLREAHSREGE